MSETISLYHGTSVSNIEQFNLRTNFTKDWKLAATFAFDSQEKLRAEKAFVYEVVYEIKIIQELPYITWNWDCVKNYELDDPWVFYNNILINPINVFSVWLDRSSFPYKICRNETGIIFKRS